MQNGIRSPIRAAVRFFMLSGTISDAVLTFLVHGHASISLDQSISVAPLPAALKSAIIDKSRELRSCSMPDIFLAYLIVYSLIVFFNCLYWIVMRQRLVLVIYALAAGAYLAFLSVAYWSPLLMDCLSLYNVPIMFIILGMDVHSTLKWRNLDIKTVFPHMDDELAGLVRRFSVIEVAKSVPVLISAPLYVVGFLLLFELLKTKMQAGG